MTSCTLRPHASPGGLGGVSGGKDTQAWRNSSHTAMVGGEIRVGEVTDGNGYVSRKTFVLPVDRRAAYRTEVKGQKVAAFGCSRPRCSVTG